MTKVDSVCYNISMTTQKRTPQSPNPELTQALEGIVSGNRPTDGWDTVPRPGAVHIEIQGLPGTEFPVSVGHQALKGADVPPKPE